MQTDNGCPKRSGAVSLSDNNVIDPRKGLPRACSQRTSVSSNWSSPDCVVTNMRRFSELKMTILACLSGLQLSYPTGNTQLARVSQRNRLGSLRHHTQDDSTVHPISEITMDQPSQFSMLLTTRNQLGESLVLQRADYHGNFSTAIRHASAKHGRSSQHP